MIHAARRARCIRWYARIQKVGGRCCISAVVATRIWRVLELAESEALLDALWAHIEDPGIAWTHQWRVGDLVLWDNRCTMHRRDPFDATSRRVMHRTQIKGAAPPAA